MVRLWLIQQKWFTKEDGVRVIAETGKRLELGSSRMDNSVKELII